LEVRNLRFPEGILAWTRTKLIPRMRQTMTRGNEIHYVLENNRIKLRENNNTIQTIGGQSRPNEHPVVSAYREFSEETGFNIAPILINGQGQVIQSFYDTPPATRALNTLYRLPSPRDNNEKLFYVRVSNANRDAIIATYQQFAPNSEIFNLNFIGRGVDDRVNDLIGAINQKKTLSSYSTLNEIVRDLRDDRIARAQAAQRERQRQAAAAAVPQPGAAAAEPKPGNKRGRDQSKYLKYKAKYLALKKMLKEMNLF
jgi:8-oxo-dGTP pyrophosphatase MutT (NUDIX family)